MSNDSLVSIIASPVVAAFFAAIGSVVGTLLSSKVQLATVQAEIAQLTKQVEKHNSTVERTYKLESDTSTMWRRIDELRQEVERTNDRLDAFRLGGSE